MMPLGTDKAWRPAFGRFLAIVIGVALLITPVCGALFGCGCDWPWSGLAEHCNAFDPNAALHRPWCEHPALGFATPAIALLSGIAAGTRLRLPVSVQTLFGLLLSLILLCLLGQLALVWTGYPHP